MIIVFYKGFVISLNCLIESLKLSKSVCFSCPSLGELLIVIIPFRCFLNSYITQFNACVEFFHFKVNCCFVCVVNQIIWVQFRCLFIKSNCISKSFFFISKISMVLHVFSLLLSFKSLFLLFRKWICSLLFFSLNSLSFFLFFSLFSLLLKLFCSFFMIFLLTHILILHVHEVNSCSYWKDIHKSWIRLHDLHHELGVCLAHLPFLLEVRLQEVPSSSFISHEFHHCIRTEEWIVFGSIKIWKVIF